MTFQPPLQRGQVVYIRATVDEGFESKIFGQFVRQWYIRPMTPAGRPTANLLVVEREQVITEEQMRRMMGTKG